MSKQPKPKSKQFEKPRGFLAGSNVDDDGKHGSAIYLLEDIDITLKILKRVYKITAIESHVPDWAKTFNAVRVRFELKEKPSA